MPFTAPELVRAAMAKQNVETPTEMATALHLGQWGAQKVTRWLKGENDPDFESTIRLLEMAGWIANIDAGPLTVEVSNATGLAEKALRLLRAGRYVPAGQPEEFAAAVERTAQLALALAADLRGAARSGRQVH